MSNSNWRIQQLAGSHSAWLTRYRSSSIHLAVPWQRASRLLETPHSKRLLAKIPGDDLNEIAADVSSSALAWHGLVCNV